MITQSTKLNLIPGDVPKRITASQYDAGSRTLSFTLYNGAVAFTTAGVTAQIRGTKPDKKGFEYTASYNNGVVTCNVTEQMTACAGEVVCELQLEKDGEVLGTANFILDVERAALGEDTDISETELPDIIDGARTQAASAAESAADAAESAAIATQAASGVYLGINMGKVTGVVSQVASTNIDLTRMPKVGERILVNFEEPTPNVTSLKTFIDGSGITIPISSGEPSNTYVGQYIFGCASGAQPMSRLWTVVGKNYSGFTVDVDGNVKATGDITDGDGNSISGVAEGITTPKTVIGNPVIVEDALESNANGLVAQIVPIQSGSGDPSPENIRPISGRTEVNLGRTGKNLLLMTVDGIKNAMGTSGWSGNSKTINGVTFTILTDSNDNVTGIKVNGTASETTIASVCSNAAFNGTLVLNGCPSGGGNEAFRLDLRNSASGVLAIDTGSGADAVPMSGGGYYIAIRIQSGYNVQNKVFTPMLRDAATADPTFEPYTPVTLTIALGTTVYGGSLDVKTGVLTVDWGMVDLGTLNYAYSAGYSLFYAYVEGAKFNGAGSLKGFDCYCSQYKSRGDIAWTNFENGDINVGSDTAGNNRPYVNIKDTAYNDASAFKTAMNGVQLCYPLQTPTTIQLTGAELALLMGYNRVTSDSGDITLTYKANAVQDLQNDKADNADIVDYIENGNKASRAYSANQFMLWRGDLYKVTTSIASGATITAGTNVTKTTIGAVLTALLNA